MNLEKYRYDLEVVRNTAEQLFKDFGYPAKRIVFTGNMKSAYAELEQQVFPILKELFEKDRSLYFCQK